jgi:hypothetical protein
VLEAAIHDIVDERAPITVRGVAYALFTRDYLDSMETRNTQKVSRIMTAMRECYDLDWQLIADNSRMVDRANTWDSPDQIIEATVKQYRRDYWQDQPEAVEIWSEKATIHGVIRPVLDELGVTFRVFKGFGSFTAVRQATEDSVWLPDGKRLTAFYIGDHDPSGKYMTEVDLPERLERYGANCDLYRIAITEQDFHLPKFSARTKKKDPRYQWFVDQYGPACWELDALDTNDLRARVRKQIEARISLPGLWERAIEVERAETDSMRSFHDTWRRTMAGGA